MKKPVIDAQSTESQTALVRVMTDILNLDHAERRLEYRKFARLQLLSFLDLPDNTPVEDCILMDEKLEVQTADGISYLFLVKDFGYFEIGLHRNIDCRDAIKADPDKLNNDEVFNMDLNRPANVQSRNDVLGN